MTQWILLWIAAAVIFLAVDAAWLAWLGRGFYVAEIGALLRPQPNLAAAGAFYLLYVTGLMAIAIWPAMTVGSPGEALWRGALLGLIAYGTYDLTNLATLKGFTARIALIDMAWGTVLSGTVAALTVWLGGLFRHG